MRIASLTSSIAVVLALLPSPVPVLANEAPPAPRNWRETKCAMYHDIRAEVLKSIPREAIGDAFAKAEEDYIAGGCRGRAYACPRTDTQLEYANTVSLRMMSGGLSGTFLPYGCEGGTETAPEQ
ncbi:hypothetical protein [Thalassospira sp. MCCC 1A03138]|uniref:hypothetical protein n=1 Tax=Thalassospira sp. MCCC 1A03138 TaxID=1470576 RepID=UPI00111C1C5F|nr:hypothetical protein [Thalassospira sp. MCCC 1A03138]